jgi:hypothetical protein
MTSLLTLLCVLVFAVCASCNQDLELLFGKEVSDVVVPTAEPSASPTVRPTYRPPTLRPTVIRTAAPTVHNVITFQAQQVSLSFFSCF